MFHERLKDLRQNCALTQKQVSDVLRIDRSTYTYYETGKSQPPIDTIIKLSKIFNVTIDSLLGLESQKQNSAVNNLTDNTVGYHKNDIYSSLNDKEKALLMSYRLLNSTSQNKLIKNAEEMLNVNE